MANLPIGQVDMQFVDALLFYGAIGLIIGLLFRIARNQNGGPKKTYNPNVEDICHAAGKMVGRTRKIGRTKKSRNESPPTTTTGEMRCGVCGNPMTFPIADVGKPSECSKCGELLRLRNEA